MQVIYLFRVKHDVQNDSELYLAEAELTGLFPLKYSPVRNFVDLFAQEPFQTLLASAPNSDIRLQDVITRLPYPGAIQGYIAHGILHDCWPLFKRLSFFRDFLIIALNKEPQDVVAGAFPNLQTSRLSKAGLTLLQLTPYLQVWSVSNCSWLRVVPLSTFEECSEHVGRIARSPKDVDRMFPMTLNHFANNFSRPFVPSVNVGFKWIEDFIDDRRAPQAYLTHAFFGLRGRFFPRMIHAVINSLPVKEGDLLLDPFCGVGTLGVEATTMGLDSIGIDINPLFTFVSKVKVKSLEMDIKALQAYIEELLNIIQQPSFLESLNPSDLMPFSQHTTYPEAKVTLPLVLKRGVKPDSLKLLSRVLGIIGEFDDENFRNFAKLALIYAAQSMLRKYTPRKILMTYWGHLWRMFYSVYFESKLREGIFAQKLGTSAFLTGDVRQLTGLISEKVDWIITSPPYCTAVDYVGNDAHSLYLLGLTQDHLSVDRNTIGSLKMLSKSACLDESQLPACVVSPLNELMSNNQRKVRALVAYYENMAIAFQQMKRVLKKGGKLVLIIGTEQYFPNKGHRIRLPIAESMKELGMRCGLDFDGEARIKLAKNTYGGIFTESLITFGQ